MSIGHLNSPAARPAADAGCRRREEWLSSDRVGFDHLQDVEGGVVRVLVEKDFACIDRPLGEEADDAYAFPNPSSVC